MEVSESGAEIQVTIVDCPAGNELEAVFISIG